ncbi:acyltransferase family protein [Roseiarcaceae bacterium H3SJ34-1]|uniref:acyltransferase family protein n=1 Tax=Terripilifer ovatus TaxID=3032367 RepID=UPI003AB9B812|nr:acyltransferase family protein [Roseiarcaceae bacterium H3SJ34-1]
MRSGSLLVGRLASLDFLRGVAALAVAVPHYLILGSQDWPVAQIVSILAVEVFFVLSGFVLAPQILRCLESPWRSDALTFLARRWMRTIPPYLVALAAITILSGNIFSPDVAAYVFYVQNFFAALPEKRDYFPVAWSLSVEEWFYIAFAVLLVGARLAGLGRSGFIRLTIAFMLAAALVRFSFGNMTDWDAAIRRATIFRFDSIGVGFLLYVAMNRFQPAVVPHRAPLLSAAALLLAGAVAFWAGWAATFHNDRLAQHLYPLTSGIFGAVLIGTLTLHRDAFQTRPVAASLCFFGGKVSYTIYLFHLIVILLLRPHLTGLPMLAQIVLFTALLVAFCAAFFYGFEAPILAMRPAYRGDAGKRRNAFDHIASLSDALRPALKLESRAGAIAAGLATLGGGALVNWSYHAPRPAVFYLALVGTAVALCVFLIATRMFRYGGLRTIALVMLVFAITLPAADFIYARAINAEVSKPKLEAYSFRDAKGDPAAFQAWWAFFAQQWMRGARFGLELPDPEGRLPFLQKPDSRGRFFDAEIRINNRGFRGPDFPIEKADGEFRVFVLGDSATFGTLTTPQERAWPEVLQQLVEERLSCNGFVRVVNAGTVTYSLANSVERLRRFIVPLKPDMVITYQGFNNLTLIDPEMALMPTPPDWRPRGSMLIAEAFYRTHLLRYGKRMQAFQKPASSIKYSDTYDKLYGEIVDMGAASGFIPVLATMSLVVNEQSPQEVIDFYGRTFVPITRILPALAEHNRIVERVARRRSAVFIDTQPALSGKWNDDDFIDIIHFTQKGSNVLARTVFEQIAPLLQAGPGLHCVPR